MKKKIILPITLAALMALGSGCTGKSNTKEPTATTQTTQDVVVNSVTIANKEALKAQWFAGENRRIQITADPAIENLDDLLEAGLINITSDNPEVVSVMGLMLVAKAAGPAKVTVTYGGKSDTVDVTITSNSPKARYGTTHEGTEEDPFDNADAVKVANKVAETGDKNTYYIKGIVHSFYHAVGERSDGCVSWFLKDEKGEKGFECYKALKEDNTALTEDDIWVGAETVVSGKLTVYSGQAETTDGSCVFICNTGNGAEKPAARQTIEANVATAVTKALAEADGSSTYDYYKVTGYITKVEGKSAYIHDDKDSTADKKEQVQLYLNYYSGEFVNAEGGKMTFEEAVLKGAKIEVTSTLKNYHGQPETGVIEGPIKVLEAGVAAEKVTATVTEALAAGNALPAGATSEIIYEITGYICHKYNWSDKYNNGSVFIAESAEEKDQTKELQVYNIADKTLFDKLAVGTQIKVTSAIQHYVEYNTKDDPSSGIKKSVIETLANPKVEILSGGGTEGGGDEGGGETVEGYGTVEAPLTIAQAKALLNAAGDRVNTAQKIFVKGIVSSSSNGANGYTIWLQSDDGREARAFELYNVNMDSSITADYSAENALVGKEVVCTGWGQLFGTTYEITNKNSAGQFDNGVVLSVSDAAKVPALSVTLNKTVASLAVGETLSLTATIAPVNYEGSLTWTSSDESVATVTNGVVTAIAGGDAVVTATVGSISATCAISVLTSQLTKVATYNITGVADAKTTPIANTQILSMIKNGFVAGGTDIITGVTDEANVYEGYKNNGKSYPELGLKFGTSSKTGTFKVALSESVSRVVIKATGWTASDKFSVNDLASQIPGVAYTQADATKTLTFDLSSATNSITFSIANRGFISAIEFYKA